MKSKKLNALLALAILFALAFTAGAFMLNSKSAFADGSGYGEGYRNRLAYSAKQGWNNDPNGLLYADGVYHMYYQYNYDNRNGATSNEWGNMSWEHATSEDLVHWTEQPVAIPAYQTGEDGKFYAMMFSGSAVYDENNTSGLFETEHGKVKQGQGIVAILTQPDDSAGGQRQILAYSTDGGASFKIHGEILSAKNDGGIGDGEFRDPKVFWSEKHGKWLMAVGGGSVRMYSSENLTDWSYLGETGYWGECPDISRFEVDGEEKYVLIISPEDKVKSHAYNGTNPAETYYPAEYYAVGDLNEKGLFVSDMKIERLSEGIDSYAFQSFNNAPDGKVYGVSWSASWKTVGNYARYRKNYNGGMTIATELSLIKGDNGYRLARKPVEGFDGLRGEAVAEYSQTLKAGENAFAEVRATEADITAELDFNGSGATYAELFLRVSAAEKIRIRYDAESGELTLDRSQSSTLAKNTLFYKNAYKKRVQLRDGKLNLRILLDRAFVSVFAQDGEASFFAAVFPSAASDRMALVSDGDLAVNASVYKMNGIFAAGAEDGEVVLTARDIHMTAGSVETVVLSSFAEGFNAEDVAFNLTGGSDAVKLVEKDGATLFIQGLKAGEAHITATYGAFSEDITVFVHENGLNSDLQFANSIGGFSYAGENGLFLSVDGQNNAFRFSDRRAKSFIYSAQFTPADGAAQAGGLVFGANDNCEYYWVATVDIKQNKVKLWQDRVGDLKVADYDFSRNRTVNVTLIVNDDTVKIYINGGNTAIITQQLTDYNGGRLGLNVFDAKMNINNIAFRNTAATDGAFDLCGYNLMKVVNVTDGGYRLKDGEYSVDGNLLTLSDGYLKTLEADTEYTFRAVTSFTEFDFKIKTDFTAVGLSAMKTDYIYSDRLTLVLSVDTEVYGLEIDGAPCDFEKNGSLLTVGADIVAKLAEGEHTVKVYTQTGRPTATVTISDDGTRVKIPEEEAEPATHLFFYIDIAIFAAFIVGYAGFSVYNKRKKR